MFICHDRGLQRLCSDRVLALFVTRERSELGCGPPLALSPLATWRRERPGVPVQSCGFTRTSQVLLLPGVTFSCGLLSKISCFIYYICFFLVVYHQEVVFPGSSAGKRILLQCRKPWFDSWVGKITWRRDKLPTPVFFGFPGGSDSKESACNAGDLGWEDPPEEGMATHSSILAWRILWMEVPGQLQSVGS